MLEVAQRTERVVAHPPPMVLFTGFGASSLDFSVRVWARFDDSPGVRSALGLAIHTALRDAGVEIPFPQQDLHLRSVEREVFDRLAGKAGPATGGSAPLPSP